MKKEKDNFLEYALKSGRIRPMEEAFEEFPPEEEDHKGNAYYYVEEFKNNFKQYKES